jgi:hypothetical protein
MISRLFHSWIFFVRLIGLGSYVHVDRLSIRELKYRVIVRIQIGKQQANSWFGINVVSTSPPESGQLPARQLDTPGLSSEYQRHICMDSITEYLECAL